MCTAVYGFVDIEPCRGRYYFWWMWMSMMQEYWLLRGTSTLVPWHSDVGTLCRFYCTCEREILWSPGSPVRRPLLMIPGKYEYQMVYYVYYVGSCCVLSLGGACCTSVRVMVHVIIIICGRSWVRALLLLFDWLLDYKVSRGVRLLCGHLSDQGLLIAWSASTGFVTSRSAVVRREMCGAEGEVEYSSEGR